MPQILLGFAIIFPIWQESSQGFSNWSLLLTARATGKYSPQKDGKPTKYFHLQTIKAPPVSCTLSCSSDWHTAWNFSIKHHSIFCLFFVSSQITKSLKQKARRNQILSMHFSKYPSVQPSRSPSMRVLGFLSSKTSPLLATCGHRESQAFLPPIADFSNVTPAAPIGSPLRCTSPLELPPLPGPIPVLPFRDVVSYHMLSLDHPLNAPSPLSLPRSSPPAESFDDALAFSRARLCNSASPVEPPLRCKELEPLDESGTELSDELPPGKGESPQRESMILSLSLDYQANQWIQVHNVEFFGRKLQQFGNGGYPKCKICSIFIPILIPTNPNWKL